MNNNKTNINWYTRIDKFLLADDLDILKDVGKISHKIACVDLFAIREAI